MKKRKWLLAVLAVALVLSASIGTAWGYFTTYASAQGGVTLHLGTHGQLAEGFQSWTKSFQVQNKAESLESVYVRARFYGPAAYYVGVVPDRQEIKLTYTASGTGWVEGSDGYWYYTAAVAPGQQTEPLDIKIDGARVVGDPANPPVAGESFNVAVVYETVPVAYGEDGAPLTAQGSDWTGAQDAGRTEEEVNP